MRYPGEEEEGGTDMDRKNMNKVDRGIRFLMAAGLILGGLLGLDGWQGNLLGILVGALAAGPITAGVTGVCPIYIPLGHSTLPEKRHSAKLS